MRSRLWALTPGITSSLIIPSVHSIGIYLVVMSKTVTVVRSTSFKVLCTWPFLFLPKICTIYYLNFQSILFLNLLLDSFLANNPLVLCCVTNTYLPYILHSVVGSAGDNMNTLKLHPANWVKQRLWSIVISSASHLLFTVYFRFVMVTRLHFHGVTEFLRI